MNTKLLIVALVMSFGSSIGFGKEIQGKFSGLLQEALKANLNAKNLQEWEASGKTPEDLFEFTLPSLINNSGDQTELCNAFLILPDADLALFEAPLDKLNQEGRLEDFIAKSCADEIQGRIEAYFLNSKKELEDKNAYSFISDNDAVDDTSNQKLLTETVTVDSSKGPVYYHADLPLKHIALTFDDGPSQKYTPEVLKILKQYGLKTNFFEVGTAMKFSPDLVTAVHADGHVMGTHSWSHPMLGKMDLNQAMSQIQRAIDEQFFILHEESSFFRFPYGSFNKPLQALVQSKGIATFFWNLDSRDWQIRNVLDLFSTVVGEIKRDKRGILLFHDTHPQTVQVLPMVLEYLKKNNYTITQFLPAAHPHKAN